jgi:hypothetical protein
MNFKAENKKHYLERAFKQCRGTGIKGCFIRRHDKKTDRKNGMGFLEFS